MSYYDNWKYSQLRQAELHRKAEAARLARLATGKRPNMLHTLVLARLGRLMVAIGRMLHQKYAPAPRRTYLTPVPQPVNHSVAGWYENAKDCREEVSSQTPNQGRLFRFSPSRGHKHRRTNQ